MTQPKEEKKPWSTKLSSWSRLSTKERIAFFRFLGIMTESGVPLEKSLMAVHKQARSHTMHTVLHVMLNDVTSGEFLSTSMKKMPQIFDSLITQLVSVGEESGTLTKSLLHISDYLEKSRDLRNKIRGAMLYPLIVLTGTIGIALYMLFVLLPQLRPMFASLHVKLPWTTQFVLDTSDFLMANGWYVIAGLVALILTLVGARHVPRAKYFFDDALLRAPVLGRLIMKTQITELSDIIATLLKSGITIVDAFKITSIALNNSVYRHALATIASSIQEGQSVSTYLTKTPRLFPPFVNQMVSVGEETGRLDESFRFLATFSEREVDDATKNLTTILEPMLMVLIGVIVGFVALAIITPIYQLTQGVEPIR